MMKNYLTKFFSSKFCQKFTFRFSANLDTLSKSYYISCITQSRNLTMLNFGLLGKFQTS